MVGHAGGAGGGRGTARSRFILITVGSDVSTLGESKTYLELSLHLQVPCQSWPLCDIYGDIGGPPGFIYNDIDGPLGSPHYVLTSARVQYFVSFPFWRDHLRGKKTEKEYKGEEDEGKQRRRSIREKMKKKSSKLQGRQRGLLGDVEAGTPG